MMMLMVTMLTKKFEEAINKYTHARALKLSQHLQVCSILIQTSVLLREQKFFCTYSKVDISRVRRMLSNI